MEVGDVAARANLLMDAGDERVGVALAAGIGMGADAGDFSESGNTSAFAGHGEEARAIEDADWLAEMAARFPGTLIVAADVRDRRVVTRGWARSLPLDVLDAIDELNALPLAGVLVTAVHREGRLQGTDLPLMEDVAEAAAFPVYAAGGITTLDDLRALDHRGVAAAVIGMALYTGAIDPRAAAGEFGE